MLRSMALLGLLCAARAAVDADLVKPGSIPGFPDWGDSFKVYSGFLNVTYPKPIGGYDATHVHYQFHTCSGCGNDGPLIAWHTGGPGGSSVYGQYAEMGHFQVSLNGSEVQTTINSHSWNVVANMLYLEEPAGSFLTPDDLRSGYSYCIKGGERQQKCSWNDVTQAESYAYVLQEFFKQYPEFAKNDFYLAGESYAGQYVPNIASHIMNTPEHFNLPLKGIAVGNGCWGGDANTVQCNGPNEDADDVELYFGKGLVSRKLHNNIMSKCKFGSGKPGIACRALLEEMDKAVGPHNVYNVYDNCPGYGPNDPLLNAAENAVAAPHSLKMWMQHSGKTMRWLRRFLQRPENMANPAQAHAQLKEIGGGYDWTCGQFAAIPKYFKRADVKAALHLPEENGAIFDYDSSGPASVTLYPDLIKSQLKVLIYNGDADTCVPYVGNQEWTSGMVDKGVVTETKAWHPWYVTEDTAPAGYATSYSNNFTFITIKLAGHQVPKNTPATALAFITRFLKGEEF